MRESSTYQFILEEGRAEGIAKGLAEGLAKGERNVLIRQGRKKFGPPDARSLAALHAISDSNRLELLAERLLDAASWDELLDHPE